MAGGVTLFKVEIGLDVRGLARSRGHRRWKKRGLTEGEASGSVKKRRLVVSGKRLGVSWCCLMVTRFLAPLGAAYL